MTISLEQLDPADLDDWFDVLRTAFSFESLSTEEEELQKSMVEPARSVAARDDAQEGRIVGTNRTISFGISVPGGAVVPAAGLTDVAVLPTHRRQGVLTRMMREHLSDAREAGDPLAILTASEPAIYGRFGYGVATATMRAEIDTGRVRLLLPDGGEAADGYQLRLVDTTEALPVTEEIYARAVPRRPGMLRRAAGWERLETLYPDRGDLPPMGCVLAQRDGVTVGYARYTVQQIAAHGGTATGEIRLRSLEADEPGAYQALWRYLFGIDLTTRIRLTSRPVDDAWQYLVSDIRQCALTTRDDLHLRPVEIGAALAARSYATAVDVVLEVSDPFCPWNEGRWRLSGDTGGAVCEPTGDPADLRLPVNAVGAVYLGGTGLASLARAGLVTEVRPGAVAAAATAFTWDTVPWLSHRF